MITVSPFHGSVLLPPLPGMMPLGVHLFMVLFGCLPCLGWCPLDVVAVVSVGRRQPAAEECWRLVLQCCSCWWKQPITRPAAPRLPKEEIYMHCIKTSTFSRSRKRFTVTLGMHTHELKSVYTHSYTHTCTHTHACTHACTHAHTCTHTHTHTHQTSGNSCIQIVHPFQMVLVM